MVAIRKPFFVAPLDLGNVVGGNVRPGHSVHHLARAKAMGLTWRSQGTDNLWVRGDLGADQAVDFCALIAANAQPGTTIRLRLGASQADVDGGGAPYDSTALPFISPTIVRPDGLYHSHLEIAAPVTARWWRIDIAGHAGDFEASALILGQKLEPSRFYNLDFEYGAQDLGAIEIGRLGVVDETPGVVLRTIDFTLAWQTEVEFETDFRPLIEALGTRGAVYLCFDPQPSAYRQARTYLGLFRKPPFARGVRKPRTFSQDVQVLSLI